MFLAEELSFTNISTKDIDDAKSGILYQKKKTVNLRLRAIFGHNYERLVNASERTVRRHLDEFYQFIIHARQNIASKKDPYLPINITIDDKRRRYLIDPVTMDDKRRRYLINTRKVPGLYFSHKRHRYNEDLASKHDLANDLEKPELITEEAFRLYGHLNRRVQISPEARKHIIKVRREKTNNIKAKIEAKKPPFIVLYEFLFGNIKIEADLDWGWEPEK